MNKPSKCKNCEYEENVEFGGELLLYVKDKEIERLNKECDTYMKIATKKDNIINELEKLFEQETKDERPKDHLWLMGYYDATKDYLDKLKELKEKS